MAFFKDLLVITTDNKGSFYRWNLQSSKVEVKYQCAKDICQSIPFRSYLSYYLRSNGSVDAIMHGTGEIVNVLKSPGATEMALSRNGKLLLLGGSKGYVEAWNVSNRARPLKTTTFRQHSGIITAIAYDDTNNFAISAGSDHLVYVWDAETAAEVSCAEGHNDYICATYYDGAFGLMSASSGKDNTVRVWDVMNGREKAKYNLASPAGIRCISYRSYNGFIYILTELGKLERYSLFSGTFQAGLKPLPDNLPKFTKFIMEPYAGGILATDDTGLIYAIDYDAGEVVDVLASEGKLTSLSIIDYT